MRDIYFLLAYKGIPNSWATEGYCKAGGFTSRCFIMEVILGKCFWILVIYLTKFKEEYLWIYSVFSFAHKF